MPLVSVTELQCDDAHVCCVSFVMFNFTQRRSCSFAEYWKHFRAHLNGVYVFGYNSARSQPIWMKFGALWVHCLLLALADFGRDRRRSDSERANGNFVLFLSGKQRAISPTSSQPNFMKFAHNMWICIAMNPFGTYFCKFSRKAFFPKRQLFWETLQQLPTSGPHNSLAI